MARTCDGTRTAYCQQLQVLSEMRLVSFKKMNEKGKSGVPKKQYDNNKDINCVELISVD